MLTENNRKNLITCALTYPYRGRSGPLTYQQVEQIVELNDYAKAIVASAGGINGFLLRTHNGFANPESWDFVVPEWPPVKPASPPVQTVTGIDHLPTGEPLYVTEIKAKLDKILRYLGL